MLYNFAADRFYIMKLCSRLFVLHCRSKLVKQQYILHMSS